MNPVISRILEVFSERGQEKYADEQVTQLEHALQCACLARNDSESNASMIAAALLHDIGHILGNRDLPHEIESNLDDAHEQRGYTFLKQHFVDQVSEPVRLHVAAKRYLVTTDPSYAQQLSPTSFKSFQDQGGKMSRAEVTAFETEPFFQEAVALRKWDDQAKSLDFPAVEAIDFTVQMESSLRSKVNSEF